MSSWYSPKARADAWEWSGTAAQLLKEHQHDNDQLETPFDQARYKRLWWSCFIRDQHISLASQCSPRMAYSALKVPMVSENDLNAFRTAESSNDSHRIQHAENCGNVNETRPLAILFIELAKLSVILNQFYRVAKTSDSSPGASSRQPDCDKTNPDGEKAAAQLLLWYCSLPKDARYSRRANDSLDSGHCRQGHMLPFHQALLLIPYYLTLIKANVHDEGQDCDGLQNLSASRRVLYARQEASRLLQDLIESDRLRHVPTDLIESLLPFATTILLEKGIAPGAPLEPVPNQIEGFKQCLNVMRIMMAQDRLRPQNDYRVSLLKATFTLYTELNRRQEGSSTGTRSRRGSIIEGSDVPDALTASMTETDPDHMSLCQTSLQGDMFRTPMVANTHQSIQQSQLVDPGEQARASHDFGENACSQDWPSSHSLHMDFPWN